MEILGIGPLELFFIVLIALIVLGPRDMIKAGRTIGQLLRRIVTSPNWRVFQQASKDIRYLPNRLMREAGLDDIQKDLPDTQKIREELGFDELKKEVNDFKNSITDWTTPPVNIGNPDQNQNQVNKGESIIKDPPVQNRNEVDSE
jgi:Sec-independent protein translocase protein TatA